MSRAAYYKLRIGAWCAAAAACFAVSVGASAQTVTITDVPAAQGNVITVFTPNGVVPSTQPIQVTAQTTGAVNQVDLGLNGSIFGGNSWQGPASTTASNQGGGQWQGSIDLAEEPNLSPNALNAFTLRAFAFTAGSSGYDASSQVRATLSGFDDEDSLQLFLDIQDSSSVDVDQNGIPSASALSGVAPPGSGPVDFEIYPDPANPTYVVQRRVQSLAQGDSPTFIVVSKPAVIGFQIYNINISTPNLAWFKSNFSGIPAVFNALNAVMVIRAESNPEFIVDNYPDNPSTDPTLLPRRSIIDEFGGSNKPFAFIGIAVFLETTSGNWTELDLAETAPLFIQIRSVQMNGGSGFEVYRYPTNGVQSAFNTENILVLGPGEGWTPLNDTRVSSPTFNGTTTAITVTESVRSATYGLYFKRTGGGGGGNNGGGGGGGGGCFVATAAYGTPLAQEVDSLRALRDEYLLNSALGSAFVDTYYRISPALANVIAERPVLRSISRVVLTPVIILAGAPQATLIFGFLAFAGLARRFASRRRVVALRRIDRR